MQSRTRFDLKLLLFPFLFNFLLVFAVRRMYTCYEDASLLRVFFSHINERNISVSMTTIKIGRTIKMHITIHRNLIVQSVMGEDDTSVGPASVTLGGPERGVTVTRGGLWQRRVGQNKGS